ncbi:unnamed protein product [Euphydryas editha]|nr:unnamed protein product [Euphydryas editha]
MIRDWCDKNSLVINKLYPTILGETFLIDNEYEPWRQTEFIKQSLNNAQDNLDETNNTFRTCLSKRSEVEVSGIQALEQTLDKSRVSCSCTNDAIRRGSIYENFSLPGSPNNIIHKNYNSKTSLKKCKIQSNNSEIKKSQQSKLTEDSVNIDRVLAVAQNKTNEWLSTCSDISEDIKAGNTRRSSASSGVSSSYSGNILLASIQEEYKYEDKEEDVVLLERRILVSSIVLPVEETADSPDQTILSVASSLPSSMEYDNNTLRAELIRLGFNPGPIQENTKTLYLKKLHTLKNNPIIAQHENKTYSVELEKSLRSDSWIHNLSPYIELENIARAGFAKQDKKWREGNAKTSFTYLLLDPRVTANLPAKGRQNPYLSWSTFINSIFYVGKGKRSRPYSHLYQALILWKKNFKQSGDKKVQHILDIWSDKLGVICLHVFQNVIPAEAYTYEAAMIDVIGLQNLKNLKTGNYYGVASSWPHRERRMLGLYLLYKAMLIFLCEGERQLRPDDI